MKRIRYSKYVPDPAGEMSMEDLLSALADYLLQSGFQDSMWYEMPQGEYTLDDLRRAIEEALMNGEMFDENLREQIEQMMAEGQLEFVQHGGIRLISVEAADRWFKAGSKPSAAKTARRQNFKLQYSKAAEARP